MKKTKKIISAALMAGTLCLTGCTSNIKFNQEDLDKVVASANEYLENQNNYSTEFAYNYLLDNLIKGMDKLDDKYVSYSISGYDIQYDIFGNELGKNGMVYKTYKNEDTNTVVSYMKGAAESSEIYSELALNKTNDELKYKAKIYYVGTKKYIEIEYEPNDTTEDEDVADSLMTVVNSALNWHQSIYKIVVTERQATNVIMDKVEGADVFTIMLNDEDGEYDCRSIKLFFEDGLIAKVEMSEVESDAGFYGLSKVVYEFDYNIEKFEIANKNSYTKAK